MNKETKVKETMMHLFREAILRKGFALVDVPQVCVTCNNLYEYYAGKVMNSWTGTRGIGRPR